MNPGSNPWQPPTSSPEPPPPRSDTSGIPWEDAQSVPNMIETIKRVLLQPVETFAGALPSFSIGPALVYSLLLGMIGGVIGNLINMAISGGATDLDALPSELRDNPFLQGMLNPGLASLVILPVGLVVGLFISACIQHLFLMMFSGVGRGFDATVRAIAFSSGSVALFQVVPILGPMVGLVWQIVANIIALRELHQTTTGKAAAAVLVPYLLFCCCCLAAAGMAAGAAGAAFSGMK